MEKVIFTGGNEKQNHSSRCRRRSPRAYPQSSETKYIMRDRRGEKIMSRYIVNGEVYIEHRFLKKTIKIEDGKIVSEA